MRTAAALVGTYIFELKQFNHWIMSAAIVWIILAIVCDLRKTYLQFKEED